MNTSSAEFPLGQKLLARWGAGYISLAQLAVQLVSFLAASGGVLYILLNVEFTPEQVKMLFGGVIALVVGANVSLIPIMRLATPNAHQQLKRLARGTQSPGDPETERKAWMEITSFPWRFSMAASVVAIFQVILPISLIMYYLAGATTEETIHVVIGGALSATILIALDMFLMEYAMIPPRLALLPTGHEQQLRGMAGLKLQTRLIIIISALVLIILLMIAPHSYQRAVNALMAIGGDQTQALFNLRSQMITVAAMTIAAGLAFAYLLARSVYWPVQSLLDAMNNIEKGRLTARATVVGTDEIGALSIQFNRMVSRLEVLQGSLEQQVAERTAQLSAVNEVGRAVGAILDPDELIKKVTNLITERFGHYYSAIFLMDQAGKWAELKNATGEAGRVLRESRHRLAVDNKSMVGTAVSERQARIALDVGAEPARFNNPLLPYTRSEIALPLSIGERVIGALDVQSTREAAFGQEDIETFQNVANQVAVALENARLFQETNRQVQELQTVQRQYLREAWTSLAASERLEYEIGDETPSGTETTMNVPLALRDEVIGQINLSGSEEWSPEERAWVESVATQAAIALENARLMDESRKQAGIERSVAEITTKIWAANTVDGILQTAAQEIGRALNGSEATIELKMDDNKETQ